MYEIRILDNVITEPYEGPDNKSKDDCIMYLINF